MTPERTHPQPDPQAPRAHEQVGSSQDPVPTAQSAERAPGPVLWDPSLLEPGIPDLPLSAFVYVPGNKPSEAIGLVRRGESGYHPITSDLVSLLADRGGAIDLVRRLNQTRGVTPLQSECMLAGSMFGWDCPAANPSTYSPEDIAKLPGSRVLP